MDPYVSFVTLAVRSVDDARRFYGDGLGWPVAFEAPGEVVFFRMAPTVVLSLWSADDFEAEVGPVHRDPATAPITLAHNVPSAEEVDRVLAEAVGAGGTLLRAAEQREWGGYTGYFADPEGYRWEVAYNPGPLGVELMRAQGRA